MDATVRVMVMVMAAHLLCYTLGAMMETRMGMSVLSRKVRVV